MRDPSSLPLHNCPTGYTFCLLNSQSEDLPLDAFVRVHDGEVFTAMFRPFQVMPDVDDHTGVHLDPPGDDDDHAETDGDSGPQQNPTHSAAFPTSSQHADTGGTEHVPGSQRSFVVFGSSVMWLAKLMTTAVLAGTWPITPDCPHTRGCELGSAVCELHSHAEYDFENCKDSQRYRNTCDRAQQQRVVERSSSMSPENRKTLRLNAIAFLFGRRVALAFCTLLVRCAVVCSCAHYCFVRHRIGIQLFVLWFLLPEAAATKVPFADASSHADAVAWRPIPTPCRAMTGVPLPILDCQPSWYAKASDPAWRDACQGLDCPGLVTLLEQSAKADYTWAFLSATLLETLEEHFHCAPNVASPSCALATETIDSAQTLGATDSSSTDIPSATACQQHRLCLEEAIPLTRLQQLATDLQQLVPTSLCSHTEPDWLDTDLGPLIRSGILPKKWYQIFSGLRTWSETTARENLLRLEIYTDGSADGGRNDTGLPCSWAFSVWAITPQGRFHVGSAAHAAAPPGTPFHIGEADDSSLTGELLALGWATIWAIEYSNRFPVPVFFCYDSTSAGSGAFGLQRPANPAIRSLTHFVCSLRQCLEHRTQVGHRHIPGHAGVIENELVDQLSKLARKTPEDPYDRCLPTWPHFLLCHPLCAWSWMAHLHSPALPTLLAVEAEAHRLQADSPEDVVAPSFGVKKIQQVDKGVAFGFKLVSYNTLTLFDPTAAKGRIAREHVGLMIKGKRDLMKQQLLDAGVWLVGLQETRLPTSGVMPDKEFLMLSSAATNEGSYGCALWVNLAQPFAHIGTKPCCATRDNIVVSSLSPRHVQVQIDTPWIRFTVLVAHGPSAVRQSDQARQFWEQRRNDLARRPEGSEVLLLVDANSCLGSIPSTAVGSHDPELESAAGFHFHGFLLEVGCMLPATFAEWHRGQSWTWIAPGSNPVKHRIDYVGVPDTWQGFHFQSAVWDEFESLQTRLDHLPVILEASFRKNLPAMQYVQARRHAVRPCSEPAVTQRHAVAAALSCAPCVPWGVDVDTHFSQVVPTLQHAVSPIVADGSKTPHQPYLTADTLALVQLRSALRVYIRAENVEQRRRVLSVVFAAFYHLANGSAFQQRILSVIPVWFAQIDISIARAVAALDVLTDRIRRAIKLDRTAYLQGLVQNLSLREVLQPKRLYAAVRKAFPQARSSRRSTLCPLPAIRMEDGRLASSAEERNERWRGFFAEQEAGEVLTDSEYAGFFLSPDISVSGQTTAFSLAALPTLGEVESAIMALRFRKASGPDGVTAETLRTAPQATAVTLYPLFLKATLATREPVEWRGGNLIALAKRATKALECSGYRSILLASVVGKIHHKIIRGKLEPYLGRSKSGLQAGTSAGVGVDMISLAVKAFRGWASHSTGVAAVTFYDIKAAYYHVLRQTLLSTSSCDRPLLALLHKIGIPSEAVCELHDHLTKVALLGEAGIGDHLEAIVTDLFRGTWFRLEASSTLTGTRRGTRPGDPLADLLFGFSFSGYLRSIDEALSQVGLDTRVPGAAHSPPWWSWEEPDCINHASWADDFVHLQLAPDLARLILHILTSTRLHVEKASAVGMSLTFAKDKSAVLFSAPLDKNDVPEIHVNAEGDHGFLVADSVGGATHFLPIVDSYRHLGGILTVNNRPSVDLAFRVSQASAVAKPLRKRLFGSQSVPLSVRCTILRSLVVSKFTFSCATADLHSAIHRRSWCQNYLAFWRTLCKRKYGDKPAHCYDVLRVTGAAPPLLALAQARSTLLRRLLNFGPPELLHLIHVHWRACAPDAWLSQIVHDIKAVAVYSESAAAMLRTACPITNFFEAMQQEPMWWKRQIKKAIAGFASDLEKWSAVYHSDGANSGPPPDEEPDALPFQCRWCEKSFALHKHVAVHEARRHGALSPARHFAFVPWCIACMRYYHTIERVQNHLRQSHVCLQRCAQVIAPLPLSDVRAIEQDGRANKARIKKGAWQAYQAATPATVAFGPRNPSHAEIISGLDEQDIFLDRLARVYRPDSLTL